MFRVKTVTTVKIMTRKPLAPKRPMVIHLLIAPRLFWTWKSWKFSDIFFPRSLDKQPVKSDTCH